MKTVFPRLVDDIPTFTDKFFVHERLACAIAQLVRKDNGGKTISIEGKWGAGKSTVINLLTSELESDANIKLINYDAWVHSGDPLRRAFLNILIDSLQANKWLKEPDATHKEKFQERNKAISDKPYWERKKEELAGKFKRTTKIISPTFSPEGRYLVLSLLLLPVSSVAFINLLVGYFKDKLFFTFETPLLILFCLASFLVLLPILIVAFAAIKTCRNGKPLDQLFALLVNKSVIEDETSAIESPDPTSIEFQELFGEILSMALMEPDRKLILVIDNLDRLNQELADSIWAMLRSFIDTSVIQNNRYEWASRLWVIIPVANNEKNMRNFLINDPHSPQENSEQFLEKVFQVRFHLPELALIDWQIYLAGLFLEAFGSEHEVDFDLMVRLYAGNLKEGVLKNEYIKPTPRSLIQFVNDIVVLKLLWEELFSLPTLCAYALSARSTNLLDDLRNGAIPNARVVRLLGSESKQDFPSIYFNVPDVKKAQQLLMRPIAEDALFRGDVEKLNYNLEANPYFENVLVSVIEESLSGWGAIDIGGFLNACIALNDLCEKKSYSLKKHTLEVTEISILDTYRNLGALPLKHEKSGDGIYSALSFCKKNEIVDYIFSDLQKTNLANDLIYVPKVTDGPDWIDNLERACSHQKLSSLLSTLEDNSLRIPLTIENWINFCERFDNDSSRVMYSKFNCAYSDDLIAGEISFLIGAGKFEREHYLLLIRAYLQKNLESYESILPAITKRISSSLKFENDFELLIDLLLYCGVANDAFNECLAELVENGVIHHNFYLLFTTKAYDNTALLLLSILRNIYLSTQPTTYGNSSAGFASLQSFLQNPDSHPDLIIAFTELIERFTEYRMLIELVLDDKNSYKFVSSVYNGINNKNAFYAKFQIKKLSDELLPFSDKVSNGSVVRRDVVSYLLDKKNLLQYVNENEFKFSDIKIYISIIDIQETIDSVFAKKCIDFLRSITEEVWIEQTSSHTWLVALLIYLEAKNVTLGLGANLRNALLQVAHISIDDEPAITITKTRFTTVIKSLNGDNLRRLSQEIYDLVKNTDEACTEKFWELFGDLVVNFTLSSKHSAQLLEVIMAQSVKNEDALYMERVVIILKELQRKKLIDITKPSIRAIRRDLGIIKGTSDSSDAALMSAVNKLIKHIKLTKAATRKL